MTSLDVRVSPLSSLQQCQLVDPDGALAHMDCTFAASDGLRCENPVPEHGGHHWVGEHTLVHAARVHGQPCSVVRLR